MRWKAIIPVSILVLLIALFNIFFLDSFIEKAIETYGSKIAEAKVDVGSVDIGIFKTHVTLHDLEVADKNDFSKNLFEFDIISFDYAFEPLLYKKLIIEEMSAQGLRWNTERKISGEPPAQKKKEDKTPSTLSKMAKKVQLPKFDPNQIKKMDWKSKIQPENLKSLKEMEKTKEKAITLRSDWENKINNLEIQKTLDETKSAVQAAKNIKVTGIQDIPKAKKVIDDLRNSQKALKQKVQEVSSLKSSITNEFEQVRSILKSAGKMKDNDVGDILNQLNLPDFSAKGLSRSLFGPLWLNRIEKSIFWIKKARRYMPVKKDEEKIQEEKPQRRKGKTIPFPGRRPLPTLLVKKIVLAGSTEKSSQDKAAVKFQGNISNITSDPALHGEPVLVDISGRQKAGKLLQGTLRGKLDHTGQIPRDEIVLSAKNINLSQRKWESPDYLPSTITQGTANANIKFILKGPRMDAKMALKAKEVKLSGSKPPKNEVEKIIQNAFTNLGDLTLSARAWGNDDDIDFNVQTNLDNVISNQIKQSIGKEVLQVKKEINDHIQKIIQDKQGEVANIIKKNQKDLFKKLTSNSSLLGSQDNQISSLTKKMTNQIAAQQGGKLKEILPGSLKNIFR